MTRRIDLAELNRAGAAGFPGLVGVEITAVKNGVADGILRVERQHRAPNGYLHAGAIVTLADTACGYGCLLSLPDAAIGFTTIEFGANFLRSAQGSEVHCHATHVHAGRSAQVWNAAVTDGEGRMVAQFHCTQLLLAAASASTKEASE